MENGCALMMWSFTGCNFKEPTTSILSYTGIKTDTYISPLNLSQVPALGKSVILNRKSTSSQSVPPSQNSDSAAGRPLLITYDARSSTRDPIVTPVLKPEMLTHQQPQRAS